MTSTGAVMQCNKIKRYVHLNCSVGNSVHERINAALVPVTHHTTRNASHPKHLTVIQMTKILTQNDPKPPLAPSFFYFWPLWISQSHRDFLCKYCEDEVLYLEVFLANTPRIHSFFVIEDNLRKVRVAVRSRSNHVWVMRWHDVMWCDANRYGLTSLQALCLICKQICTATQCITLLHRTAKYCSPSRHNTTPHYTTSHSTPHYYSNST